MLLTDAVFFRGLRNGDRRSQGCALPTSILVAHHHILYAVALSLSHATVRRAQSIHVRRAHAEGARIEQQSCCICLPS